MRNPETVAYPCITKISNSNKMFISLCVMTIDKMLLNIISFVRYTYIESPIHNALIIFLYKLKMMKT